MQGSWGTGKSWVPAGKVLRRRVTETEMEIQMMTKETDKRNQNEAILVSLNESTLTANSFLTYKEME